MQSTIKMGIPAIFLSVYQLLGAIADETAARVGRP